MAIDPKKYADFDKMIRESKAKGIQDVIVATPQTLGDNYEELIANLNKLASAGLRLNIAKPCN
jgi:hypothetical protein